MFERLSSYPIILVTGPQRSGTTICAKMIAHDAGHEYVDETRFEIDDANVFNDLLVTKLAHYSPMIVVQCPAMCRHIHLYGTANILVIVMIRSVEAILKSQTRIEWDGEDKERERYEFLSAKESDLPIAQIKYDFWKKDQQFLVHNSKEVGYSDLDTHPLWIPKEERLNFAVRQTMLEPEPELEQSK